MRVEQRSSRFFSAFRPSSKETKRPLDEHEIAFQEQLRTLERMRQNGMVEIIEEETGRRFEEWHIMAKGEDQTFVPTEADYEVTVLEPANYSSPNPYGSCGTGNSANTNSYARTVVLAITKGAGDHALTTFVRFYPSSGKASIRGEENTFSGPVEEASKDNIQNALKAALQKPLKPNRI